MKLDTWLTRWDGATLHIVMSSDGTTHTWGMRLQVGERVGQGYGQTALQAYLEAERSMQESAS